MGRVQGSWFRVQQRSKIADSSASLQRELHENYIQPLVELESDLREAGDFDEAVLGVEAKAGVLQGVDAGDDGVDFALAGALDLVGEQGRTDALALVVGVDVDGVFDGEAIARSAAEGV